MLYVISNITLWRFTGNVVYTTVHIHTTYGTYFSFHRVTLDIIFTSNRLITPQVWCPYGEII